MVFDEKLWKYYESESFSGKEREKMKRVFIVLLFCFISCQDQNKVSEVPADDFVPDVTTTGDDSTGSTDDTTDDSSGGSSDDGDEDSSSNQFTLISEGTLEPLGGYNSSGDVSLIYDEVNDEYLVTLENFTSSNGPDLHVYIASDNTVTNFLDLGELRSTSGTLTYTIPGSQYNEEHDTVLIWCVQFSVNFGQANLE